MKLIYTEHVRRRMAKRKLREEWIERVISNPLHIELDEVDATLEHRLAAVPELANRVLGLSYQKMNRSVSSPRI